MERPWIVVSTKKWLFMLGCQVQFVPHSASLFTKACESVLMMLEPYLETSKHYPVLTRLLTVTLFSVHSSIILYSTALLQKKYFPTGLQV